ncbi:MAG: HEAT repeat domain-containing protein [Planctomycetota bacterium]
MLTGPDKKVALICIGLVALSVAGSVIVYHDFLIEKYYLEYESYSSDPDTRENALDVLGERGSVMALRRMRNLLGAPDEEPGVRRAAAEAMVRIGLPSIPYLLEVLEERDAMTRMTALRCLGRLGPVSLEVLSALEEIRDNDPSPKVVEEAAAQLKKIEILMEERGIRRPDNPEDGLLVPEAGKGDFQDFRY